TGDGGDELFGGYDRYRRTLFTWGIVKRIPKLLRGMTADLIRSLPRSALDHAYGWIRPWMRKHKYLSGVGRKAHRLAELLEVQEPQAIYRQFLTHWKPSEIVPDSREPETVIQFIEGTSWLPTLEEQMMLIDMANYLPDDVLAKVDRASMAVSLE